MFVFYDTETTGLDQNCSQILQISLILTDDNFNILSSKKLECRTSPWMVPTPGSLLTTKFDPKALKAGKLSHFEMMREVDAWLRQQKGPLTFVGFNTFGYDERVLAQNFYQNLLDPRLTTAGGNNRTDIAPMVRAIALYMPGALKLDIKNDYNEPSLSLINVAQQNGVTFSQDEAHDSMNDTKATVALAKVVQKLAPQIWAHMVKLSTQAGVEAFIQANPIFTQTYGRQAPAVVVPLAKNGADAKYQMVFDLSFDPAAYMNMSEAELKTVMSKKDKDKNKEESPFRTIRTDAAPILMPMNLSAAALPKDYDEKIFAARAAQIAADKDFIARVEKVAGQVAQRWTSNLAEMTIDRPLDSATQANLNQWTKEFHAAVDWKDRVRLIGGFSARFESDSHPVLSAIRLFATRIVYEHAPEELSVAMRDAMKRYISERILNKNIKVSYTTVAKAQAELTQIEKDKAEGKVHRWDHVTADQIQTLRDYYTGIEKEYAGMLVSANDDSPQPPKSNIKPKPPGF